MTEAFQSYREDFQQYRDDAMRDIKAIPSAPNPRKRAQLAESAESNIMEAERYLRILENEARAGDSQERRRMQQQLRSCKSNVDKLKSNLDRAKLIEDSQQRLQNRPKSNDPKENMVRYQQRLDRTGNHLNDAQRTIAETEALANNITTNLQDQRDHLVRVRDNVDATQENTTEAGQHLKSLKRKTATKIMVLYFIVFALVVIILFQLYRLINKLTSKPSS